MARGEISSYSLQTWWINFRRRLRDEGGAAPIESCGGVIQGGVAMDLNAQDKEARYRGRGWTGLALLVSTVFYVISFLHLRADFPNGSPWTDWSKMTDEGWYGGGAVHHFVQGSWYLPGSFNPAVAMPVWPAMLGAWFAVTGVSMIAARTLTMLLYGVSLVLLYKVAWRARPGKLAAIVVLLTVMNPFCYAFDRLALLEPVTVFWMMLALWLAGETKVEDGFRQVLLGVVVALLLLTKVTGVALVPAILYFMWAGWGWPGLRGLRWRGVAAVVIVVGTAGLLLEGYMRLGVMPHYLADYRLLFSINAYRVHLSIVPTMAWVTLRDGGWLNPILFPMAMVVVVLSVVWLRELWRVPLFGASLIAIMGHLAYIAYHTNFQPRYYLVIAMPMVLVIGLGVAAMVDRSRTDGERLGSPSAGGLAARWSASVLAGLVLIAAMGMVRQTVGYGVHPEYSFWEAAEGIAAIMQAEGSAKPLLLSDSGDDISLWTGVPAVSETYTTQGLDAMLNRYQPGWYAAWQKSEQKAIERVGERYRLNEVARYRVFDDPKRQTLVLYKLTPR
jgi:4-amino-4-deoxy-L-arabinose transferase-like glycosyltransferase